MINKNGIYDLLGSICEKPLLHPIYFKDDNGTRAIECLVTYDLNNMDDPNILAFANMCHTVAIGSTHVNGFVDSLTRYFRDYMNKIYLTNNKKLQVSLQDIRTGLRAVISCKSLHPSFTGQSKEVYSEKEMLSYAATVSYAAIDAWAKKNPTDLQKLCKYFKDVCVMRTKLDGEKIKMHDKYVRSPLGDLPDKYITPNNKRVPFELIIVEG